MTDTVWLAVPKMTGPLEKMFDSTEFYKILIKSLSHSSIFHNFTLVNIVLQMD